MSDYQDAYADSKRAALLLATAFMFDTDIEVDPDKLRLFILNRWTRVAPLAHRIHMGPDMTKADANAAVPVEPSRPAPDPKVTVAARLRDLAVSYSMNGLGGLSDEMRKLANELDPK